jgi:hypothetical protein
MCFLWGTNWICIYVITCLSDYRRGLDWRLDLLTTLTHDLWLHLIIAPSLIDHLQITAHAKSFQSAVFISHFLVTASNSGDSSTFVLTSLLSGEYPTAKSPLLTEFLTTVWTLAPVVLLITSLHGPRRKRRSLLYSSHCHMGMFVCEGVTQ